MKCAALLVLTAGGTQAFMSVSGPRPAATVVPATAANGEVDRKLTPVFPEYTRPDPQGPLGAVGEASSKGLQKIFPEFTKPDPSASLGEVGDVEYDKHKLTPVFPEYTKPDPRGAPGSVGMPSSKGLQKIFPDFTTPDPSANLGDVGDVQYDKHKLTPVFPEFTKPDPKGDLGEVGSSDKKGLNPMFPTTS